MFTARALAQDCPQTNMKAEKGPYDCCVLFFLLSLCLRSSVWVARSVVPCGSYWVVSYLGILWYPM